MKLGDLLSLGIMQNWMEKKDTTRSATHMYSTVFTVYVEGDSIM